MIKINVILSNFSWKKYLKNPKRLIGQSIRIINKKDKTYKKKLFIFTLLLSGAKEIKKLNKKFRKKNKTTDILSFPFNEKKNLKNLILNKKEIYLGDVILNIDKIKGKQNNKSFKSEFNKLWIHGFVHLLGYKHKTNIDFNLMKKIEKKYLNYIK